MYTGEKEKEQQCKEEKIFFKLRTETSKDRNECKIRTVYDSQSDSVRTAIFTKRSYAKTTAQDTENNITRSHNFVVVFERRSVGIVTLLTRLYITIRIMIQEKENTIRNLKRISIKRCVKYKEIFEPKNTIGRKEKMHPGSQHTSSNTKTQRKKQHQGRIR